MEPTIKKDEVVTADLRAFESTTPIRWDVVVFEPPFSAGQIWVSRVVGLPGEVIDITPAGLSINGKVMSIPSSLKIGAYTLPPPALGPKSNPVTKFPYHISSDSYFVMGDNVNNALDSRYWGALKSTNILGRVFGK